MNPRMKVATAAVALGLTFLAGCGSDAPDPDTGTATTPTATPTPTDATTEPAPATDLVGRWSTDDGQFAVEFADDGTYVMDFQGVEDFKSGEYTVDDDTVTLGGGDGTDVGTLDGETLTFKLGVLTKQ